MVIVSFVTKDDDESVNSGHRYFRAALSYVRLTPHFEKSSGHDRDTRRGHPELASDEVTVSGSCIPTANTTA
jgi:hypothetical protein